MDFDEELDLRDLVEYFVDHLKWIIIIVLIAVIIGNASTINRTKLYKSSTSVMLLSDVGTYAEVINSNEVLAKVKENLGLSESTDQILKYISYEVQSGAKVINITVVTESPQLSQKIAKEVDSVLISVLDEKYNVKNASILRDATLNTKPSNINRVKENITYILIGLVGSSALLIGMYYLDTRVVSKKEIEKDLQIPVLGSVPKTQIIKKGEFDELNVYRLSTAIDDLKENISFNSFTEKTKKILLTSPSDNDGKSFIALHLASAYAKENKKVLIIDCNLRQAKKYSSFNAETKGKYGYTDMILNYKDNHTISSNYISKTNNKNIDILPCGTVVPNPVDLIKSANNGKLIERLSKEYNVVIFDCASTEKINHTLSFAKYSNIDILVASYNKTTTGEIQAVNNAFKSVDKDLTGVVLNQVKVNKKEEVKRKQ